MKEYYMVMAENMNSKIVCNLCGKKYGGKKGISLHFKYSHGINLKNENFNTCDTIFTCRLCLKNALNCNCSLIRHVR